MGHLKKVCRLHLTGTPAHPLRLVSLSLGTGMDAATGRLTLGGGGRGQRRFGWSGCGASTREARRRACRRTYEPATGPEAGTLPPSPFPCRAVTGAALSSQRRPKSGTFPDSTCGGTAAHRGSPLSTSDTGRKTGGRTRPSAASQCPAAGGTDPPLPQTNLLKSVSPTPATAALLSRG